MPRLIPVAKAKRCCRRYDERSRLIPICSKDFGHIGRPRGCRETRSYAKQDTRDHKTGPSWHFHKEGGCRASQDQSEGYWNAATDTVGATAVTIAFAACLALPVAKRVAIV